MIKANANLIMACLLIGSCRGAERAAGTALESAKTLYQDSEERQLRSTLKQTRELGSRATTVVFYEVANEFDHDFAAFKSNPRIAAYPIRTKRVLSREAVSRLVGILSDRSSYFPPNDGWTCIFEPHHVLQLQAGDNAETIVICVHCGDVDFHLNGSNTGKSLRGPANGAIETEIKSLLARTNNR